MTSEVLSQSIDRPQRRPAVLWPILLVWLLFAGVSFLGVAVPGVNEPHYVCKARSLVDPDWCDRDFFLRSANVHWCFLLLTGWWTQWSSFGLTVIVGRVLSALVLALGWNRICGAVGLQGWRAVAAAGLFALLTQSGSFSGEWILGGFESKVPAWGLGWAALGYWIDGVSQWRPRMLVMAGLCCGLSLALHPVVGGWFGLGIGGTAVMTAVSRAQIRTEAASLGVFGAASVLAAMPGLLPAVRFLLSGEEPAAVRERAIFVQVYWRLRHHMDPVAIRFEQWCYAGVLLAVCLVLGVWLLSGWRLRALSGCGVRRESLQRLLWVLLVSLAAAAGGVVVGWHELPVEHMGGWQWRGSLLRFYPFRFFDGLLPCVTAMMVVMATVFFLRGGQRGVDVFGGGLQSFVGGAGRWFKGTACLAVLFSGPWGLALCSRPASPAGYTTAGWRDWQAACLWLQQNTERESLVLTPRESFAFKWFSERAEYVSYKDCPQDPAGIVEWDRRLWAVHQWSAASLRDGRYDDADLARLRELTECDYVLIRGQEPFAAVPVWTGEYWKIYRVNRLN